MARSNPVFSYFFQRIFYVYLGLVLATGAGLESTYADYADDDTEASVSSVVSDFPDVEHSRPVGIVTSFTGRSFESRPRNLVGDIYSVSVDFVSPGAWRLGAQIPMLMGYKNSAPVQEMGNPVLHGDFHTMDLGFFENWLETSGSLSRQGARIANRHDTFRAGMSFRFPAAARLEADFGGGYRARVNEEDPGVDLGDMVDAHFMFGFKFGRRWALDLRYSWLRSMGLEKDHLIYARATEWGAIAPGLRYRLANSLSLTTILQVPVFLNRNPEEAEAALWDVGGPDLVKPTLTTSLGVTF